MMYVEFSADWSIWNEFTVDVSHSGLVGTSGPTLERKRRNRRNRRKRLWSEKGQSTESKNQQKFPESGLEISLETRKSTPAPLKQVRFIIHLSVLLRIFLGLPHFRACNFNFPAGFIGIMYYVNDVRAAPAVKYISVLSRRNKLYFSKHCSVTMANTETSLHLRKWGHGVDGCGQETISYISNGVIQFWSRWWVNLYQLIGQDRETLTVLY